MATAPSLPAVSVDEYFAGGFENEWEYVDGELVSRRIGSTRHSRMVIQLGALLFNHRKLITTHGGFVVSVTDTRFRVPDVACYPADVEPGDDLEQQPPPLAVFEVLSKTDPLSEMQTKCQEYAGVGVKHVFIIDYTNKAVLVPRGAGFLPLEEKVSFDVNGSEISIPFSELFAGF